MWRYLQHYAALHITSPLALSSKLSSSKLSSFLVNTTSIVMNRLNSILPCAQLARLYSSSSHVPPRERINLLWEKKDLIQLVQQKDAAMKEERAVHDKEIEALVQRNAVAMKKERAVRDREIEVSGFKTTMFPV